MSVRQPINEDGSYQHICGGAIYKEQWIITAIICFPMLGTEFVIGEYNLNALDERQEV